MLVDPFVASLLGFAPAEQNFDSDLQAKGACKGRTRNARPYEIVGILQCNLGRFVNRPYEIVGIS